jgi:hypothetical protein
MEDVTPNAAAALKRRLETIEARIGQVEGWLAETQAAIEREGWSATLDRQLKDDEQLIELLRRLRNRIRAEVQGALKQQLP